MSIQRVFLMVAVCLSMNFLGCWKAADEAAEEATTTALGSTSENAIESESGGKVDAQISDGGLTIRSGDGEMTLATGAGAKVPAEFPKDVLVYEGAVIVTSAKQGDTFMLNLKTQDDAKKVVETYKNTMPSSGWKESESVVFGPQTMLSYRKGGNSATVSVAKGAGTTIVNLVVEIGGE